ncbi:MAG: hypothetical protein SFV24_19045 [Gemmatimonadales bacterium]|nr:hypothetical protein [Gemmatimonadales bacterium]
MTFALRWPILLSIVVAGAAGWIFALMVERYGFDTTDDPTELRHQKLITFGLNWAASTGFTTLLWDALVPEVPLGTRLEVSVVASVLTAFTYPILARLATKRWPDIGSAWSPRE